MASLIRNRKQAQQIKDFSGLHWGKITPTDIDAMVEFGGRLFIFMECKHNGCEIGNGQRLAYMRAAAAVHSPPRHYAAIIWASSSHNEDEDIDYANLQVIQCWWPGEDEPQISGDYKKDITKLDRYWYDCDLTIKKLIDALREYLRI